MKHDKWTNAAIRENVKAAILKAYSDRDGLFRHAHEVKDAMKCSFTSALDFVTGCGPLPTLPMLCRFSEASGMSLDEIVMGKEKKNV